MVEKQPTEEKNTVNIGLGDVADVEPFGYAHGYRDAIQDQLNARITMEYARSMDWYIVVASAICAFVLFRLIYAAD